MKNVCHKSSKIGAAGAQGKIVYDFWTRLEAPFSYFWGSPKRRRKIHKFLLLFRPKQAQISGVTCSAQTKSDPGFILRLIQGLDLLYIILCIYDIIMLPEISKITNISKQKKVSSIQ